MGRTTIYSILVFVYIGFGMIAGWMLNDYFTEKVKTEPQVVTVTVHDTIHVPATRHRELPPAVITPDSQKEHASVPMVSGGDTVGTFNWKIETDSAKVYGKVQAEKLVNLTIDSMIVKHPDIIRQDAVKILVEPVIVEKTPFWKDAGLITLGAISVIETIIIIARK